MLFLLTLTFFIVIAIVWGSHWVMTPSPEKVAKKTAELKAKEYAKTHPQIPVKLEQVAPTKMRFSTPETLTIDYGFSLEANAPIMVQYPDEKPFLFDPGGDNCQQLPQPQHSGPKKFWDPNNKENGHIGFRIYRGRGKC